MFYEANLNIACVDGAIEGIISKEAKRLLDFLKERDHEGSSVSMVVRDTPESFRDIDNPEEVYRFLESEAAASA